jgi:ABC-type branched-subunit amino acid transport system substrate-binding protein
MRARNAPVGLLTFALALSAIGLGACSSSSKKSNAAPTTSTAPAAPQVTPDPASSPFTSKTAFCTKDNAQHTGLTASAPGVTADSISVVAIEAPLAPGDSPQGYRFNLGDPVDMLKVFAKMVNECGGINGRKINLTVVQQAGGAADQAATVTNAQAACVKATEDNKPFIVLSWTGMFAAPQCITDEHKTLMMSGIATTNEYLRTAQGRHILMGNTNEVAQYQAPMLDLIDSGKFSGKKVAVLYPTFTSGQDLIKANVVELLKSKGVNVVYSTPLTPDPAGDISSQYPLLVQRLKQEGVDVIISGSAGGNTFRFSALTKELRNQGAEKDVTMYNLDARFDAVIDLSRQVGGVDGAKLINDMNINSFAAAGQQDWRTGATEGDFVTMCNKEYDAHTTLAQADLPEPAPPAFARDPYATVAGICAMYRTLARAFYNAGPNLTQETAIKAFEELPYLDNTAAKGSPAPRANQIINQPPTKVEYTQVLVKPEYPCAHPSLPPDPVNYRICLIPQPGYDQGGKAVNGPFFVP